MQTVERRSETWDMKLTDWFSIQVRHCKCKKTRINTELMTLLWQIGPWVNHFFHLQTLQNICSSKLLKGFFFNLYFCCFVVFIVFQSVDLFILESVTKVNSAFRQNPNISWIAKGFFFNCTPRKGTKAKNVPFKAPCSDTLYIIHTFSPIHSVK